MWLQLELEGVDEEAPVPLEFAGRAGCMLRTCGGGFLSFLLP